MKCMTVAAAFAGPGRDAGLQPATLFYSRSENGLEMRALSQISAALKKIEGSSIGQMNNSRLLHSAHKAAIDQEVLASNVGRILG